MIVQSPCLLTTCRLVKVWLIAFLGSCEQSELRDCQRSVNEAVHPHSQAHHIEPLHQSLSHCASTALQDLSNYHPKVWSSRSWQPLILFPSRYHPWRQPLTLKCLVQSRI